VQDDSQNFVNMHANCLIVGSKGILLLGGSGCGKSSLTLQLLQHASAGNLFSALVADDQVFISGCNNRLIAMCPPTTKGQIEIRGFGISKLAHISSAIIDLVVEIIPPTKLERMPEKSSRAISGIELPLLAVPQFQWEQACQIVMAGTCKSDSLFE